MIEEAISKIQELSTPKFSVEQVGGRDIIVRSDLQIEDPEKFLATPYRKRAEVKLRSADSFVVYVNDHKEASTHLFGSIDTGEIVAEIDYHGRGDAGIPAWREHKATLTLPKSPDWQKWCEGCGTGKSQTQLAEFLEEMDHTIAEPEAARIIEIVEKLKLTSDRRFESSVSRATGAFNFTYVEDTQQTKGTMKLPDKMMISVAPWRFAKPVDMIVYLRYRLTEGKLTFHMKMDRPDLVLDEAFTNVVNSIQDKVGLPVLMR